MKTYRFKGERTYIETFTIDVEAESLEDAQEMVDGGDYEEYDHNQDFVGGSDSIEFEKEID
jgi:hypothetical protein